MDIANKKKELINYFLKNDILLDAELISFFEDEHFVNELYNKINQNNNLNNEILLNIIYDYQSNKKKDKHSVDFNIPKNKSNENESKNDFNYSSKQNLKIINDYNLVSQKREVEHFVSYFSSRFKKIEKMLKERKELSNIISISLLKRKKDRENVSVIGLIRKKEITKNDNIILTIEDLTGEIKVLINKKNKELYDLAKDLIEDEVIGVVGMNGDNILFSNTIIQPDIPLGKELKKSNNEEYAVFLSDIHFGSKYFLKEEFEKFISWIRMETGTQKQREIAKKVKYIFIVGDLVDGIGIYPNQENELEIFDIYEQYNIASEYISKIPKNIDIVICPGNHDAVRMSEPQPKLSKVYAKKLYELDNVKLVSNPAYINISSNENFSGFDVLLYHGYSFDYYVANVESIRLGGGYDRADLIMKFLLKRRHLAPTYSSTLFVPDTKEDALVIDKVPDFFVTGHIHKTAVNTYRNITLISGSCWQSKTTFQEKVGHNPEPAKVPVVNLKTRNVTILNFEIEKNKTNFTDIQDIR